MKARRPLEKRLHDLDERIPHLESEFAETGDPVIGTALRSARDEAERVREALTSAVRLEDQPHDPAVVELGDTVTVREVGSSELARFTVVGELEARLDSTWISVEAPVGSALLGSRPGDVLDVQTPGGTTRFKVLKIE